MLSDNSTCRQVSLARVLKLAGDRHAYQWTLAFSLCMVWVLLSFQRATESYLYQFPTFYCGGDTNSLIDEESACGRDDCIISNKQKFHEGKIILFFLLIGCFVLAEHYSLTSTLGLYCDKKYTRELITSMEFPGIVCGLLFFGALSNKFGRRPALLLGLSLFVAAYFCTYFGALYSFLPGLFAGAIVNAFSSIPLQVCTYLSMIQCADKSFSDKSIVLMYGAWGVGQMLMNPIVYFLPSWKQLILYFHVVSAVSYLLWMFFFFKESPRFLLSNPPKCKQVIQSIASFNSRMDCLPSEHYSIVKADQLDQNEQAATQKKANSLGSFLDVVKKKQVVKIVVLFTGIKVLLNIIYAGTSYSLAGIGLGFRGNILVSGLLEAVGYILMNFFCDKLPRKRTLFIALCCSTLILVSFQFTGKKELQLFQSAQAGLLRLVSTVQYSMQILFLTESFKAQDRSAGTSLVQIFSFLSSFTPFLLTLGQKLHMNQMAFIGVLSAFGLVFLAPLKETKPYQNKESETERLIQNSQTNSQGLIN